MDKTEEALSFGCLLHKKNMNFRNKTFFEKREFVYGMDIRGSDIKAQQN